MPSDILGGLLSNGNICAQLHPTSIINGGIYVGSVTQSCPILWDGL